jgi:hypothetical protein
MFISVHVTARTNRSFVYATIEGHRVERAWEENKRPHVRWAGGKMGDVRVSTKHNMTKSAEGPWSHCEMTGLQSMYEVSLWQVPLTKQPKGSTI